MEIEGLSRRRGVPFEPTPESVGAAHDGGNYAEFGWEGYGGAVRTVVIVGVLAALMIPSESAADPGFALSSTFDRSEGTSVHLVPPLRLGLESLFETSGSGAARTDNPALALVLGIIPGFGLGHYVAGSPRWTSWLVIDALVLAGAILLTALDVGVLTALTWIAFVVERVIEGLDAYHAAGGGRLASRAWDGGRSAGARAEADALLGTRDTLGAARAGAPVALVRF